jgi:hypothetical protein
MLGIIDQPEHYLGGLDGSIKIALSDNCGNIHLSNRNPLAFYCHQRAYRRWMSPARSSDLSWLPGFCLGVYHQSSKWRWWLSTRILQIPVIFSRYLFWSAGCATTGNNVSSQNVQLTSRDSGGNAHFGYITLNPNGAFNFQPDVVNNTAIFTINKIGFPITPAHTFANLPSPSSGTAGALVYITDSPTTTIGATVTVGGGSNKVYLGTGGTNWTVLAVVS